jgi:phosphatidylserine/phosphatidylglycerophosphate/cardiolipin synthase-like enzyme
LQVRVLNWDFAALYTFDRELLPAYKLGWQTHPRLCFRSDARHPVGASHHQKFVVIDDTIAFCGGLDLTRGRWDTSIHDPDDERRVDVEGRYWRPYHDVQMLVAGPAASQLGELARQRWQGATGESLSGPAEPSPLGNIWPGQVRPDVDNCEIAIARTLPKYEDQLEVREVEQSYLDMIAEARRLIYI